MYDRKRSFSGLKYKISALEKNFESLKYQRKRLTLYKRLTIIVNV
jgi:hypothetical protein